MISMGEFDAAEDFIHRIRASLVGRLEPFMDQVIRETKARLKSGPRSHHGDPAVEEAEARFRHAIWPFRRAPSEEIIEAAMGLEHALVDTDPW
jgi:hypothetical protein